MKSLKFRIILFSFLASLPFWFGVNFLEKNLENLWFEKEIGENPDLYFATAGLALPRKHADLKNLEIGAESAISVLIKNSGQEKIIFEKNSDKELPIASLSKIMSADVFIENFDLSQNIIIPKESALRKKLIDRFEEGEIFIAKDLLFSSLVESDNDGIAALAEAVGYNAFVNLMNLESNYLGLNNTKFYNPTGLDPIFEEEGINVSSANDVVKLTRHFLKKPIAPYLFSLKEYNLYTSSGIFHHTSSTTNTILVSDIQFKGFEIIGGKTGSTKEAKGCLILTLKNKKNGDLLINVILGSEDRFGEMEKLVNWAVNSSKI